MKVSLHGLATLFLLGAFLTSSFDIFLNIKIAGFSLRFVFIFILLLLAVSLILLSVRKKKEKLYFLGFYAILTWVGFLIIFIPNTTILTRNIAYVLWLILYLMFIPVLPIFFRSTKSFAVIIKYYFLSFRLVAIFGIVQFILGLFGVDILIMQYWHNGMPRANAFSYEPSYFATYLMLMWVTAFILIIYKSKLVETQNIKNTFGLITIAIILSGSRMGILFMVLIIGGYILSGMRGIFTRFKIKKQIVPYFLVLTGSLLAVFLYFSYNFDQLKVYVNGLGLFGTVGHSYDYRTSDFQNTVKAFRQSPVIGYSLGGIPSAIAQVKGIIITTQQEAKQFEGVNIFAEVLAASGIFGFIFFAIFFYNLFKKNLEMIRATSRKFPEFSILLKAMLFSLFFELVILSLNQNILRAYVWIHIAMVNLAFYVGLGLLKESSGLIFNKIEKK